MRVVDKDVSVRVGLTMYSGVSGYTLRSMLDLARTVPKLTVDMESGSFTVPARCRIMQRSIEQEDDFLLFVDSDMNFVMEDIKKLFDALIEDPNIGAISGNYVRRDGSYVPVCNWLDKDTKWLEPKPQAKRVNRYMKKESIVPVDVFGAGLLLINKRAMKKADFPYFDARWITYQGETEFSTEDYHFLLNLKDKGFIPKVHFGVNVGHHGEMLFVPVIRK